MNFNTSHISTYGFYELLKLSFENNYFEYDNHYFRQIKGVAMGAKHSPSIANMYIALLEKNFINIQRPLFYYRFIDDIFMVVNEFFNINLLIEHFGYLKLKCDNNRIVNFLDLNIYLNLITGFLIFSLYTKPTNTFSFLLTSSNHP